VRQKVLWIDEDTRIWAPERRLLNGLGFDVTTVTDATSALRLANSEELESYHLIIIDVMLVQGEDEKTFSDEDTDSGLQTGLVLAEKFVEKSPSIGRKLLFFSRATDRAAIATISQTAAKIGGHYLAKRSETQGRHFIKWLEKYHFIKGSADD
jgi:CheY-like chemotaxis protein